MAAVSVALFGSIMTLFTSFRQTDEEKIKLIYSLGGKRRHVLSKVLVGVIIGEFLAANAGLGYLIIYGQQTFRMDQVVMSIAILCLVSAVLYQGIFLLEKKIHC